MKKQIFNFLTLFLFSVLFFTDTIFAQQPPAMLYANDDQYYVDCPQEVYGRSFMFTRPLFNRVSTEQAAWHNFIQKKNHTVRATTQVIGAYQHTRENAAVERYFLINGKNELLVAGGDNVTVNGMCRDIWTGWLGLPENFVGTMRINPQQTQYGVLMEYNQDIGTFLDVPFFRDSWFSVQFPLTVVNNNIRMHQTLLTPESSTFPNNLYQAFNNPAWCYGRIGCNQTAIQVPWVSVMMGSPFMAERYFQIGYYTGITIPTSKKADPKYLFSPIAGYNGHIGINAGVTFNILLNKDTEHFAACLYADIDNIFLVRAKQKRTFDLKDKPWSRYMLYHVKCCPEQDLKDIPVSQRYVPGVNLFTRDCIVHPYNIVDFITGFRFTLENKVEIEFGYGIWGRTFEWVYLTCQTQVPKGSGLIAIAGPEVNGNITTASKSTISKQAAADDFFIPVDEYDIDPYSGSAWAALNHNAHGSINYLIFSKNYDAFIGAGWYLDFPQKNGALQTWGAWGKVGASF